MFNFLKHSINDHMFRQVIRSFYMFTQYEKNEIRIVYLDSIFVLDPKQI